MRKSIYSLLAAGSMIILLLFSGCGGGLVADSTTSDYDGLVIKGWAAYNKGNFLEANRLFTARPLI